MYLGIDLGTSGVKVIMLAEDGQITDSESYSLSISRPHTLWSEQDPEHWWLALDRCMTALAKRQALSQVRAIGLSGQMHGATLLDQNHQVIRPAILWNDGRAHPQCKQLEDKVPDAREITGNLAMPGFTAPKLLWVKEHEPTNFSKISTVLLPKDYLQFRLTGELATDMSDAAGTLWLDVAKRRWSEKMLTACGLQLSQMPRLLEGNQIAGYLHTSLAQRWDMSTVPVVAGAGDNAAGAIGAGLIHPGQAMISLGTSGVYFAVSDGFLKNPKSALHSFCHALPGTWHLMSVVLSAASCLSWYADNIVKLPVSALLEELEQYQANEKTPLFLPYLSGERTPHNNPQASGMFFALTHQTQRVDLTYAVLEGVAFALAEGTEVLHTTGLVPKEISLIGGGARSPFWRQLLANTLNRSLTFREGGDVGPALGAARLAKLALHPKEDPATICPPPPVLAVHQPNACMHSLLANRLVRFKALYQALRGHF
ncbi:xylulokinase [Bowmanella yangjiangensis]|uniref:Xylulose kinase n=1 Tax=Bowmanella yangjiangensis TaxID=2811230 RepID=A0ABS3CND2_9ALTE|nr:xylulokinase [Bowmanella yangjiangensis]MBN7818600.1 xylulokinase [Bowmanella yangjiangensis]